jgi:hypothetical protein
MPKRSRREKRSKTADIQARDRASPDARGFQNVHALRIHHKSVDTRQRPGIAGEAGAADKCVAPAEAAID